MSIAESEEMARLARLRFGVDGCRGGWVVAQADVGLLEVDFVLCRAFTEVLALTGPGAQTAVDIPIGLPENSARSCDRAARGLLPVARKSSVFPAPCRATLAVDTYEEQRERNRNACGKAISKQLHYILPKIREVDEALTPAKQEAVHEAHPEVIFAILAGNGPPLPPKKTPAGCKARLGLLAPYLVNLNQEWLKQEPRRLARQVEGVSPALDDLVDALACLIAAHRVSRGEACHFPPDHPEYDSRGFRMEIVA